MRKHVIWIMLLLVGITACAKAPMQDEQMAMADAEMSAPEIVTVSGKVIDLTCAVKGKAMMGTWDNTGNDHVMEDGSVMKGCAQMCLLGGLPAALFKDNQIQAALACNPAPTLSNYAGEEVELQGFWATSAKEDGLASFVPQKIQLLGSEEAWETVVCELLHE